MLTASALASIACFVEASRFISQLLEARHEPREHGCMNVGRSRGRLVALGKFWSTTFKQHALEFDFELEAGNVALEIREI